MQPINLIWLQGQGCTGDTVALLSARDPSLVDVMTGVLPQVEGIQIAFHPTIMAPWGETALEPLEAAKEGKLDPFVLASGAEKVVGAMQNQKYGRQARVIGEVTEAGPSRVMMRTRLDTTRIVNMITGDLLPRIC